MGGGGQRSKQSVSVCLLFYFERCESFKSAHVKQLWHTFLGVRNALGRHFGVNTRVFRTDAASCLRNLCI